MKGRTIKTPESANGEYYLQIKAIDNAKNEEEVKSRKFIIDNKKPTIEIEKDGNTGYEKQANSKVTVMDENEIKSIEYKWTKEGNIDVTSWKEINNRESVKLEGNNTGSYYLNVKVKDIADNEEEIRSKEYRLDNNKPKIITQGEKIEVQDLESGVEEIRYAWKSTEKDSISEWIKIESGTTIPKSNLEATRAKYVVEASDKAGNKSTYESQEYIIDKEAPIINLNRNGNVEFEKEPKAICSTSKTNSGVQGSSHISTILRLLPRKPLRFTPTSVIATLHLRHISLW